MKNINLTSFVLRLAGGDVSHLLATFKRRISNRFCGQCGFYCRFALVLWEGRWLKEKLCARFEGVNENSNTHLPHTHHICKSCEFIWCVSYGIYLQLAQALTLNKTGCGSRPKFDLPYSTTHFPSHSVHTKYFKRTQDVVLVPPCHWVGFHNERDDISSMSLLTMHEGSSARGLVLPQTNLKTKNALVNARALE